ncbi:MAG: hypothetical protein PF518_03995, partial [Spirochaetaceae bacterium]|nr:hypothetical protein [Spirochaetaceae bacterium]
MAIKEENKQRDFFTYAQYKHWPEEERWELIHGEAFDMSYGGIGEQQACLRPAPAPGMNHQDISGRIFMQIANFLEGKPCR